MGKIALFLLLIVNAFYSLANPWFGICVGYMFNILGPQYIWWWHFQGLRAFYLIAIPTILGFLFGAIRGALNFEIIKNKLVLFSVLYFFFVFLSYFTGPYIDVVNKWRFYDPYQVLITMLKVFIFYFIGLVCISEHKKLKYFAFILPIAALYLTYWANMQYFSGRFFIRLSGPRDITGAGMYSDENNFAMLFVTAIPFFFYLGWYFKRWYLRWGAWLVVPFAWHAIFLTASRGGLLGAGLVSLLAGLRSPKKIIGVALIPAFIIAYVWQGGSVIKQRAQTIKTYEEESSARARLEAWEAGLKMLMDNPLTGVGLASFGQAFPFYSDKTPRMAHNTFVQIAAESGIFAGLFYILFMFCCVWGLFKYRNYFLRDSLEYYLCDAVLVSLCGFLACSLFLTLNGFEIQFYLAILANTLIYLAQKSADEKQA
ncbi:hypothetical protein TH606_09235 [Thermodesulfatator autotrophicus]|uniref:O-antigen ligase-related domain-containing protein n=2 Tax=Thermodesulfatator autotrophicus TaxID=1795632 RepID=A0A177E6D4_9BACT|nr:hypothetical protein TH606_09235 [Thermodesulfatator autotrophicus]